MRCCHEGLFGGAAAPVASGIDGPRDDAGHGAHVTTEDVPGLDKLTAPQMAAWLRETAVNTRKHSDPAWCAARVLPYDPVAAHVAFRMEQAAELIERLGAAEERRRERLRESIPETSRE